MRGKWTEADPRAAVRRGLIGNVTMPAASTITATTLFQLVVNLATTKALDLKPPATLRARPDDVIE